MFNKVNDYYWQNLNSLPLEKQLHYASRMWLWSGKTDTRARQVLDSLKPGLMNKGEPEDIDQSIKQAAQSQPQFGARHASERRAPYFAAYPTLQPSSRALFRALYIEHIYNLPGKQHFLQEFALDELQATSQKLQADTAAVQALATHAVNFVYLIERFLQQSNKPLAEQFYALQQGYEQTNDEDRLLQIYLLTHCIVGESLFYNQPVTHELPVYQQMCHDLEVLIERYFERVSLDNKFEMLVCFKLCGLSSKLEERILQEAEQSFAPDGDFVIDTHNSYQAKGLRSFSDSEHRNALLVMATTPMSLVAR